MKKIIWICCILGLLCLTACKNKTELPTETGTTQIPTVTLPLDDLEFFTPTEDVTEPAKQETLAILDWGTYDGLFVEDGSDRQVEDVPCLLIRNTTDKYLDYGIVYATIGDRACSFVVTGLPGGCAVWVQEAEAQPMTKGETFTYVSQTVSQLRDLPEEDRVEVQFLNGELAVTNVSDCTFATVRIYYKRLHTDGNCFGGITYTTGGEQLAPGQTMTLIGGHSTETGCIVARIDCTE